MTPLTRNHNYESKRWLRNRHNTDLIDFHHLQRIRAEEIEWKGKQPPVLLCSERRRTAFFRRLLLNFSKLLTVFFVVWLLIFHKTSSFLVTCLTCCSSQLDFYATLCKFERITVVIATGPLQLGSGDHNRLVYVGNTKMVKIWGPWH